MRRLAPILILAACTRAEPVKESPSVTPTAALAAPSPTPASTPVACPYLSPEDCALFAKLGEGTAARVGAYRARLEPKSEAEILALRADAFALTDLLEDFEQDELVEKKIVDRMNANTPGVRFAPRAVMMVLGEVDLAWFRDLAEKRGQKDARAYFDLLARTHPRGPFYWEQQTDEAGCDHFRPAEFSRVLDEWLALTPSSPELKREVQTERERLVDAVLTGTCICEDEPQPLLDTLEAVAARVPAQAAALRARSEQIRAKKAGIRFGCVGG